MYLPQPYRLGAIYPEKIRQTVEKTGKFHDNQGKQEGCRPVQMEKHMTEEHQQQTEAPVEDARIDPDAAEQGDVAEPEAPPQADGQT